MTVTEKKRYMPPPLMKTDLVSDKTYQNAPLCALTAALTELVFGRNSCRFGVNFLS